MSLVFKPIEIVSGLLAGVLAKKLFALIWGLVDDQDAPRSKHRRVRLAKLIAALVLEGAVLQLIRGLVDHGTRHGFSALAGEWPGEETPEAKED